LEIQLEKQEHHLRDIEKSDKSEENPMKKKRMELFIQTLVGEEFKKGIRLVGVGGPSTPTFDGKKNPIVLSQAQL
jgi:hypothetical protein